MADASPLVDARVMRVRDGDSIAAVTDGALEVELRLAEIDAPELSQPTGRGARLRLEQLVADERIRYLAEDRDRYGRVVARVYVGDLEVNRTMVEEGWAWASRRHLHRQELLELERSARAARRGLWAADAPVAPWEWRAGRRGEERREGSGPVIGNRRSRVYHEPHCPSYADVGDKNRLHFGSAGEAEAHGFRRAGNCPPS